MHDASDIARLEQRVRELERKVAAYDEFLSTLGHELRNPLSPIFLQAQYLLDISRQAAGGTVASDWLSERLQALCGRLQKFLDMLNRIMDMSRVSAGRVSLQLETFDAADVVRDICASFE